MKKSAQSVQTALDEAGVNCAVVELPASTRSASEAAAAIGCDAAQIVKSLIFRAIDSGKPILVLAAGHNRVDEKKVAQALGESIEKSSAAFVKEMSGFAIGGVPPIGHKTPMACFIDRDLQGTLWAAAGTQHAVFEIAAERLTELSGGQVIELATS